MRALCEHLHAAAEGRLLAGVFWPEWGWADFRGEMAVQQLSRAAGTCDSVNRRLIESAWYQERWGDRYQFGGDTWWWMIRSGASNDPGPNAVALLNALPDVLFRHPPFVIPIQHMHHADLLQRHR